MIKIGEELLQGMEIKRTMEIRCESEPSANQILDAYKSSSLDIQKLSKERKTKGRGDNKETFYIIKVCINYDEE